MTNSNNQARNNSLRNGWTQLVLVNSSSVTIRKQLFFLFNGGTGNLARLSANTITTGSIPYLFTSGITVTYGPQPGGPFVTVSINLAGQSLTANQVINILNANQLLQQLSLQFTGSAAAGVYTVNAYAQQFLDTRSDCSVQFDSIGTFVVTSNTNYPIQTTVPGGISNLTTSLLVKPMMANRVLLFGTQSDIMQAVLYNMNEEYGYYNELVGMLPKLNIFQKQPMSDMLDKPRILDGNSGITLFVSANSTLTIYMLAKIIGNGTLNLLSPEEFNRYDSYRQEESAKSDSQLLPEWRQPTAK